ncbi:ETAA1 protein, partial [Spizella passerina]|nr:ETAA1 protein [Spizella passerina]
QDEKASCNEDSLLGTWIGEDAIPCTPIAVKGRARTKLSYLKIKNPEEELMKLAKEFDKNLVELDAVQEQEKLAHNFIQSTSEPSSNSKDEINTKNQKSLLGEGSEADPTASLKPQRSSGNSVTLLGTISKSNSLQYSPLKHSSKNSQHVKSLSLQKPCKTENAKTETKALHGKCDVKPDKTKSVWKSTQNSDLNHIPVSVQSEMENGNQSTKPKSNALPLFPSRFNPPRQSAGKPGNNTHTISCQSSSVSTNMKPNDLTKVVNQANTGHSNQVEIPKKCPLSFGDWNEPKFSDEILGMFRGSDSLWDANCEDDELLYQVCDDIEKQTQSQDVKQGNEKIKTVQGASINSRSNADNSFPASKQGLPDLLLAQKTNAKQEALSLNDACRNSSKTVHGLATTGHVMNCKNISNPLTAISGPSVECKYTLPKSCHQDTSEDTAKAVSGKWYRSNSVPAGETGSEVSPVNAVNTFSRKALDSSHFLYNAGKIPSSTSGNKTSLVPSKFKFRKINSSQGGIHVGSESSGSHSGIGITLQDLKGSKNQVNITLHRKLDNKKSPFKRHLSESFAQTTS